MQSGKELHRRSWTIRWKPNLQVTELFEDFPSVTNECFVNCLWLLHLRVQEALSTTNKGFSMAVCACVSWEWAACGGRSICKFKMSVAIDTDSIAIKMVVAKLDSEFKITKITFNCNTKIIKIKVVFLNELKYNCLPVSALPKRIMKWCLELKT